MVDVGGFGRVGADRRRSMKSWRRLRTNQDRSVEARKQFVYRQEEMIALRKQQWHDGMRGEAGIYTMTPGARGIERRLVKSEARRLIGIAVRLGSDLSVR